jgi:hypothetical protein
MELPSSALGSEGLTLQPSLLYPVPNVSRFSMFRVERRFWLYVELLHLVVETGSETRDVCVCLTARERGGGITKRRGYIIDEVKSQQCQ